MWFDLFISMLCSTQQACNSVWALRCVTHSHHLAYINIQGRNQKIYSFVFCCKRRLHLDHFRFYVPTFIDNITRYPLSGSVLFRQKSPIALRHFTDSVILLPLEFGFRADFVQRRKSSFLRIELCIRLPLKLSFSRALICAKKCWPVIINQFALIDGPYPMPFITVIKIAIAQTYLQLPLRQWGVGNIYLLVVSSWKVNIAKNPIAVMGL